MQPYSGISTKDKRLKKVHFENVLFSGWLSGYSDSLWARRSGDRIPVGARFSAPAQTDPGGHPGSYTLGTGSFPGAKRPGSGVDHPPPSSAEVEGRVELYLYSPSGPSWPVVGRTSHLLFSEKVMDMFFKISYWIMQLHKGTMSEKSKG